MPIHVTNLVFANCDQSAKDYSACARGGIILQHLRGLPNVSATRESRQPTADKLRTPPRYRDGVLGGKL